MRRVYIKSSAYKYLIPNTKYIYHQYLNEFWINCYTNIPDLYCVPDEYFSIDSNNFDIPYNFKILENDVYKKKLPFLLRQAARNIAISNIKLGADLTFQHYKDIREPLLYTRKQLTKWIIADYKDHKRRILDLYQIKSPKELYMYYHFLHFFDSLNENQ